MDSTETAAPDPAALGASMAQTMPPVTGAPAPAAPPAAANAETGAPAAAPASPEVDAKGRPFDPAKFLPKKNKAGLWMPKSPGRFGGTKRPESLPPAQSQPEPDLFQSAASTRSRSSSASSPASSPGSPSGGVGSGSYIPPETDLPPPPSSTQSTPGAGKAEAPPAAEPVGGADDVAAVAVDLLSEGVGLLTGAPEEAEPSTKEGARLRDVLGAYLRSKGVETRGVWAVVLAFAAWFVRTAKKPKTRAWVKDQVNRRGQVIDIEPRQPSPAAPAPAAAPEPAPSSAAAPGRGVPSYSVNLARR
jgi:hypothetical protein